MKRVILTTGGTGGHIFPALAVAEELRRRSPDVQLLFLGSLYGPEYRLAENAGIPFVGLAVRGVLGRGVRAVPALLGMGLALPETLSRLKLFSPDCAVGFGGYASFVPMLAARMLRIPTVLHEQNAVAGATNSMLARMSDRLCTSLPSTSGFEARKSVLTGNPVRQCIFRAGQVARSWDRRHLLVVGGSQGAHALNALMVEALPALKAAGVSVWHQTGTADEAMVQAAYEEAGMTDCRVAAFIDNMQEAYEWADLGLCRAGATTVAELCAAGLPSLLVPFPQAINDHQTFNARALEKAGAARLLVQKDLTADILAGQILDVLCSAQTLASMSCSALCLANPEAAANVVGQMEAAIEARRKVKADTK